MSELREPVDGQSTTVRVLFLDTVTLTSILSHKGLTGVGIYKPSFPRKRESTGWGVSFDKLKTNEMSVYLPL